MSITISTDVFCDADGCGQWAHGITGARTNAPGARNNAKRLYGWSITRKGDFCPECARALLSKDTTHEN
jgi:hypothetical protein